ncbi:MAG TPA: hypothetical protein VEB00_07610 [Clostridia bacterium]|nr:hypothetical protein [Clostridia bacterium]
MKRGKYYAFISMVLVFSLLTSIFAYAADSSGLTKELNPPVMTAKEAEERGIKVIHKEAPAPSLSLAASWTENTEMYNQSSFHVQVWTKTAIGVAIASLLGQAAATVAALAGTIYATSVCAETHNVYYKIRYYWQPSDDPELPYYVKQVFECYSNLERTDYIGQKINYYYSTLPF